jgi:Dockerin type I domain
MKHLTFSILFLLATSIVLNGYPTIITNKNTKEFSARLFDLGDNYSCTNDSISFCENESEQSGNLAPPVIISSFPLCPHYCEDMMHPNIGDIVYTTDCPLGAVVTLEGPVLNGMANCTGTTYTYTYVVTDNCGAVATLDRVYVIGNAGPTITCPPFNLILSCGDPNNDLYINTHLGLVSANSSCQLGLTITNDYSPFPQQNCAATKVVVFTATDACGQSATCSTTIVIADNTAPVITQIPPSVCDKIECGADADYWFNHWIGYMLSGLQVTDDCDDDVDLATIPANPVLNTVCDDDGKAKTIVTFAATDFCGNSTTVTGTFTMENNQPVYFSNVPLSKTISCDEDVVFGPDPDIHEVCQTTLVHSDDANLSDPCTTIHVRTWLATDACGELARSTAQTITVVDDVPPVFSNVPANESISCANNVLFGNPIAADECTSVMVQVTNSTTGNNCNGSATRIWTATDQCGNSASISQTITYNDVTPPVFTSVSPNATAACFEDVSLGTAMATDECGSTTLVFVDSSTGNDCSGTVTRTWTATDACENVSTTSQIIIYNDNIPPIFSNVPDNGTVSCLSEVSFGTPTASDNCSDTALSFGETITGTVCSGIVTRVWIATDECGNSASISRTISYSDTEAPTFSNVPDNGTVSCLSEVSFGTPTASDNCSDTALIFGETITGTDCSGIVTRVWIATDECGNSASISRTISYSDTEAPTFSNVPDNGTVSCLSEVSFGTPTASDNCSDAALSFGETITGTVCSGIVTRVWIATDECGNSASISRTISYSDTEAPTFSDVPVDGTVSCFFEVSFGTPTASDNCSDTELIFEESITGTACSGSVTRVWIATDECGNSASISQTITYDDSTPPVFSSVPPNATVGCFDDVSFGTVVATDECGSTTVVFVDSQTGNNCSGIVTRTWTASDACGNVAIASQAITYNDITPPTFGSVPTGGNVACLSDVNFGTPTTADDCTNAAITFLDNITGDACTGSVVRTWVATDDCGNAATVNRTISYSDTQAPVIAGCASSVIFLTITQAPVPPLFVPVCTRATTVTFSATDNCTAGVDLSFNYTLDLFGDGTIDDSGLGKPNGFVFSYNYPINWISNTMADEHILTYTVTDECGNTSICTRQIVIRDIVPPTQFCSPVTLILDPNTQSVSVTPMEVSGEIFECQLQSALFQIPGGTSNLLTFNCDDYNAALSNGIAIIMVTIQFLDIWGNASSCTNSVILELPADMPDLCGLVPPPGIAGLQGQLLTPEHEAVENVNVHLGGSVTAQMTTAADGQYNFTGLPDNNNYTLTPILDANPLNGVSSYDLVLIQKHVIGNGSLDSPYKKIAADINKSGSISTLDVLELRRMILHIDEAFSNNNSWRFVPADFVFATPENPFASLFPEQAFINGLTGNETHDFVGIKVGDVNSSAVANTFSGGDDRDFAGRLILNVKDKSLRKGQTYQVAFTAENFEELQGYQFSLFFDKDYLAVIDLVPGKLKGISLSNFGLSLMTKGFITTSWTDVEPVSIGKDEPLFYLTFEARQNVNLSEVMHISSQYTVAEAYDKESRLWDIGLRFDDSEMVQEEIWLYQNMPNPFYHETLIGFELPQAAFVVFEVVDASGLELKRIEQHFPKGYNSIIIDHEGLSAGLLYYRMTTSGFTETKKMVLQH